MTDKPGLQKTKPDEAQLDDALKMTFPASDPMTYQNAASGARVRAPEEAPAGTDKSGTEADPPAVPGKTDLTRTERPGGDMEMPQSERATDLRDEANAERDSNDLKSGVST